MMFLDAAAAATNVAEVATNAAEAVKDVAAQLARRSRARSASRPTRGARSSRMRSAGLRRTASPGP